MKKYLYPAIGAIAFVVGGILVRQKTLENLEVIENFFSNDEPKELEQS
jgi:hypothetical protein